MCLVCVFLQVLKCRSRVHPIYVSPGHYYTAKAVFAGEECDVAVGARLLVAKLIAREDNNLEYIAS